MKNLLAGLLFLSLAVASGAQPVEPPAPTTPPQPIVTTTTNQPAATVEEVRPVAPAPKPETEKEKPRKKKPPLEIKWIEF